MTGNILGMIVAIAMIAPVASVNAQDVGRKVILTPDAPKPIGPYSQAIGRGKTLYLSGQIAIDPATNQFLSNGSIEDQTRRVLDNLAAVLAADDLTMDHIVSTTVFLKDVNDFAKMNEIYAHISRMRRLLGQRLRSLVYLAIKIEISAIAVAR